MSSLLTFTLKLADDELILGHRLSEWCGHGPLLEQDIALSNAALDHLGAARTLYQYAADQYNLIDPQERRSIFNSPLLDKLTIPATEDDMAYLRDGWDFKNCLLVEQPNGDWADTIARSFYYDVYHYFFLGQLLGSIDETFSAVAEKSLKEATYHRKWSSEWVVRLGDGTPESHSRMQTSINKLWRYTGELFDAPHADRSFTSSLDMIAVRDRWIEYVSSVLSQATLSMPAETYMQRGGRIGRHTEHLGYILADMQHLQRTYPGMDW